MYNIWHGPGYIKKDIYSLGYIELRIGILEIV